MSGKRAIHSRPESTSASQPAPALPVDGSNGRTSSRLRSRAVMPLREVQLEKQSKSLTVPIPTGEQETRRSSRATKGQHTKAFDALDNEPPPKPKKNKRGKKPSTEKEEEDEEVIRCVCGATSQDDDDANEPWIACEKCGAWQHNICMGMSIFEDDLPKKYYCEQCRPEDHKPLIEAMGRGEKLWETRRQEHEESKKKKKGGKKAKGKRTSDPKDRSSPALSAGKAKASPTPEVKKEDNVQETPGKGKRKSRDQSQGPQSKLRKVSETQAVAVETPAPTPAIPEYTPPGDLAESIDKLEPARKAVANALRKSLDAALEAAVKNGSFTLPRGSTKKTLTERHALEIERAVIDSHPNGQNAAQQLRTLVFNLKKNVDLAARVFNRTLQPPALAIMSSDEMATAERQRETAELKAKADKQAILITEDGPRMRKTHKGDEMIETDNNFNVTSTEDTPSVLRRQSMRDSVDTEAGKSTETASNASAAIAPPATSGQGPLHVDTTSPTQHSPRQGNFDINKVFSTVRSPSGSHQRRPSAPALSAGPVDDPEVDRLLQDDGGDSPPYSPTENIDPDVVWQGPLTMTNICDIPIVAKFAGGADLSKSGIPWKQLLPPILSVAGRIPEEKAVPYLCGLRYANQVDIVITSLSPANLHDPRHRQQFMSVIDYFRSKKRYGVVGTKNFAGVRDTYLVPVSEGNGPIPEPLQNLEDHLIPSNRSDPMLLLVLVVRDETQPKIPAEQSMTGVQQGSPASSHPPTPSTAVTKQETPVPTWSPATPQAAFPNPGTTPHSGPPHHSHTPIPPPVIPGQPAPPVPQRQTPVAPPPAATAPQSQDLNALRQAQAEGERKALQILGPLFNCPVVTFLLPHADKMKEGEWGAVKLCLERDPRARTDLPTLVKLLTEAGNNAQQNGQQQQAHVSAATASVASATANAPPAGSAQPNMQAGGQQSPPVK